jgi:Concanavalin A-like lectin/glucanases superfamily
MSPLLLVAPLIVFALVVVLGFVGCPLRTQGGAEDYHGAEILLSGPIAWWRLSDPAGSAQAKDEIGDPPLGTRPGTYSGNAGPGQWPSLVPGGGPHANFGGGSVDVGGDPAFQTLSFSVEAMVLLFPDTLGVTRSIVENHSSSGGWELGTAASTGGVHDGVLEARLFDDQGLSIIQAGFVLPVDPVPWHVAMTVDNPTAVVTLYLNGTEVASGDAVPFAPNTLGPLQIGVGFLGGIQEVAVYDRPLTPQEISDHFQTSQGVWPH